MGNRVFCSGLFFMVALHACADAGFENESIPSDSLESAIQVSPSSFEFVVPSMGVESALQSFSVVTTESTNALTIKNDSPFFKVSGDTCSNQLLDVGDECLFWVTYTASSENEEMASISIDDGIYSSNLVVSGYIADSVPEPEPEPEPCLLYTSPSPRDATLSRMPSSA